MPTQMDVALRLTPSYAPVTRSALADFAAELAMLRATASTMSPYATSDYRYPSYSANPYYANPGYGYGYAQPSYGTGAMFSPTQRPTSLSFQIGDLNFTVTPSTGTSAGSGLGTRPGLLPTAFGAGAAPQALASFNIPGVGQVQILPERGGATGAGTGFGTGMGLGSPSPFSGVMSSLLNPLFQGSGPLSASNPYALGGSAMPSYNPYALGGSSMGSGATPFSNPLLQNLMGGTGIGSGGLGSTAFGGSGLGSTALSGMGGMGMGGMSGMGATGLGQGGRPVMMRNGDDDGFVSRIGFGNPVLDDIFGTNYNGIVGGGNAERATNNPTIEGGLLGSFVATNSENIDYNGLASLIDRGIDPLSQNSLRSFKQEGGKNVYTGYLDGTPDAIADSIENGRINGATLANQGNNTKGQKHWTQWMGVMEAGPEGTVIQNHNVKKGQTVPAPGGGFMTFIEHANGGDHNGVLSGVVVNRQARSAEEADNAISINNTTRSASDLGQDGTVQAGSAAAQALARNQSQIPGLGTKASGGGGGHGGH